VVIKHVAWRAPFGRLPWWLVAFPRLMLASRSDLAPPWPDIWLAAGRATLPLSLRMRRWSRGRTLVVQTQHPRTPLAAYDLIIPPAHDRLTGANVLPVIGTPNRLTPQKLKEDRDRFDGVLSPLPHPRVAVVIGGASKAFALSPQRARTMAAEIAAAVGREGGSLMLTFSRRTPAAAREILTAELKDLPGIVWDGAGDNPYFAFLGAADAVLVTEDSANMATDAAATGKPVFILKMDGASPKFALFHESLQDLGIARPFEGALEGASYSPLTETDRAAGEILHLLDARRAEPTGA
jgi:hypothetical protein